MVQYPAYSSGIRNYRCGKYLDFVFYQYLYLRCVPGVIFPSDYRSSQGWSLEKITDIYCDYLVSSMAELIV